MTKAGIVFHHRVAVLGRGLAHRAQGDARADAHLLHALERGGAWPRLRWQPIGGERQGSGLFGMARDSDDDDDRMSFLTRSLDWNTLLGLSLDHSPVSPTRQMNLTRSYSDSSDVAGASFDLTRLRLHSWICGLTLLLLLLFGPLLLRVLGIL